MPRKSKQRGDKYGPLARRRRGQGSAVPGHEARHGSRVAMTLDDLMEGYSDEDDGGGGVLRIGGIAIRTGGDGGIRHVKRKQARRAAHPPELGSPEGGVTLESGAWGEHSASSTDGEESGLADFVANLAANRGNDEGYDGLEDAMHRFARTDIGGGAAPEDARGGLDNAGSSGSSGEDTSTTEAASDAGFSPSDSDSDGGGGGGGRVEHAAAMEALFPGSQPKRRKAVRGGAAGRVPPGEARAAKKARKAALRAARSERRGFSLAAVNAQLRDFVAADGDLMGLPDRMGKHDGAAVQRLAALYGLKCTAQGAGKRLTIMVASTRHTAMPEGEQADRVRELLWRQAALSAYGGRVDKLPPGSRPPGQAVHQRGGGGGGRGGGGRMSSGSRGGRSGGKGNWKARFGARPDGAPPPTPAYLQPMAFVSHGTLQPTEERVTEDTWGFRQQGMAATPSAVLEAAAALPDDVDQDMSKDEADAVADTTQGLGLLHQGLGFASASAASPAMVAARAAAGLQDPLIASPSHVAGAAAAPAAGHLGSGRASVATAYLADSNDSSSDDDIGSALLGSSGDGGDSPPILYDVAYSPGLGSGGLGVGLAAGLGFTAPTAALGSAGGPGAAATSDAAPVQQPFTLHGSWQDVTQATAASDVQQEVVAAVAMAADAAREPAATMSASASAAPVASLRWFDGPGDDGIIIMAGSPADSQRQQHDDSAPGRDSQSDAQRLRDLARAAAEQRAIGGGASPMQLGGGGGRRPAIGLMTPNETAAQVRRARKKEEKLARRAAREAKLPGAPPTPPAEQQLVSSVAAKYGGFEAHTTGFGSRMMARWGFGGAGAGLGASQQGIAEPVTAVRRGKGVGLGAE